MEFRILGPLEVYEDGRLLPVSGKQRALLALLLLEPRQALSRERLVDELWGDDPPETAAKAVQVFAGRLPKRCRRYPSSHEATPMCSRSIATKSTATDSRSSRGSTGSSRLRRAGASGRAAARGTRALAWAGACRCG